MSGPVDLGYELNAALGAFLDEKSIIRKQQAKVRLLEILWDNKAGIIAHLLDGTPSPRPENCATADAVCHFPSCVCVDVKGNIIDPSPMAPADRGGER